ncbi:FadR/GntR family transcriptional regulator [Streptomyces sp. GbtcB6]|uniref:FadR/GntR family transcriptional regulator n=1 Tax=Streptomyces sp. GbtcB6 TaxID=2824751 RepID=UPI001C2FEB50|nr:FCD domain-containing protein [Streptomyces sp. GbtcB6]
MTQQPDGGAPLYVASRRTLRQGRCAVLSSRDNSSTVTGDGVTVADSDEGRFPGPEFTSFASGERSVASTVAARIRDLIHRGELHSGDRMPAERELCVSLGVARLTLRQALAQLRDEGYTEVRRGAAGGTFISGLAEPAERWAKRFRENPDELDEILELRAILEGAAAARAAIRATAAGKADLVRLARETPSPDDQIAHRRADIAFHQFILRLAENPRLFECAESARAELFVPASTSFTSRAALEASSEDHVAIAGAISSGDPEAAQDLMERHIAETGRNLHRFLAIDRSDNG